METDHEGVDVVIDCSLSHVTIKEEPDEGAAITPGFDPVLRIENVELENTARPDDVLTDIKCEIEVTDYFGSTLTTNNEEPKDDESDPANPGTSADNDDDFVLSMDKPLTIHIKNLPEALKAKPLSAWTAEEIHGELGRASDDEDDDVFDESGDGWYEGCRSSEDDTNSEDYETESDDDIEPKRKAKYGERTANGPGGSPVGSRDPSPVGYRAIPQSPPSPRMLVTDPRQSPSVAPVSSARTAPLPAATSSPAAGRPLATPPPLQVTWQIDNPSIPRNDFVGQGGLKEDFHGKSPYEWWCMLVTDQFLQDIVDQTNRQAVALFVSKQIAKHSRLSAWKELTVKEFKVFLGLLFMSGVIKVPTLEMHWMRNLLEDLPFPVTPGFGLYMGRNRFAAILQCLHFARNSSTPEEIRSADPLYKINYLVDYFYERMRSLYYPFKDLCIDERLVLWRGRLSFHQYLPGEKHKYGVKLYALSEPSGLVLRCLVYCGRRDEDVAGDNHAFKVVRKLLTDHLDQGHSVYMDKYYNSIPLAEELLKRNTYVTGTLRSIRRHNPDFLKKKLKKGQVVNRFTSSGICVLKWQDKSEVRMVSAEFSGVIQEVQTGKRKVKKPECIVMYNDRVGGVDKQGQMLNYYPFERKTVKWYKKIGIHIFDMLMRNAITLCKQFNAPTRSITALDMRKCIIEGLLHDGTTKEVQDIPTSPPPIFKDRFHVPEKVCDEKGKTKFNRCKYCLSQTVKIRKMVCTKCTDCPNPTFLCIPDCFRKWHLENVYK